MINSAKAELPNASPAVYALFGPSATRIGQEWSRVDSALRALS